MRSFLLFFFTLAFIVTKAQFDYKADNVVNTTGTYADLNTNGTAITTNFGGGAITYDEDNSAVQNIGFTFFYNGTSFTQFVLHTDGFIRLGSSPTTSSAPWTITSFFVPETNLIAPFNRDLVAGTGGPEYRVYTSGAAGSRVCTIQFKNLADYGSSKQFSNMSFQVKLYETTNNVEFVYGTFTSSGNTAKSKDFVVGLKADFSIGVYSGKAANTVWGATTFVNGGPVSAGDYHNATKTELPTAGRTYRFTAVPSPVPNDAQVKAIYLNGKYPIPSSNPITITASVKNTGTSALTNLPVTLNITGSNSFSNIQTIASLGAGASETVSFAAFSPTIAGSNTVTVSVPADNININNSATETVTTTTNSFSSRLGTVATGSGSIGWTGNTVDYATRFNSVTAGTISQLTTYFYAGGASYQVSLYNTSGSTPGTALWTSPTLTASTGANVVSVPSTAVTGDFFVVVSQLTTTDYLSAYEAENPARWGKFYFRTGGSGPWIDFGQGSNYRLMVDVVFTATMPVQLVSFTGAKEGNLNRLKWTTATEENNRGFYIERSADGKNFSSVSFVKSKSINGTSSNVLNYDLADANPLKGDNYYRLRQVNNDGGSSYSNIVHLKTGSLFGVSAIYPNPAKDICSLQVVSDIEQTATLSVIGSDGKLAMQIQLKLGAGTNNTQLNVASLAKGNYIITVTASKGNTEAAGFIRQ
jgi:hypothetical protein